MKEKDTTLTPLWMVNNLGLFDLDPCAYPNHPTAKNLFVLPTNGLLEKWDGRVWLNPPYSNPSDFLEKMVSHGNGIALVLASVETKWFHKHIWESADAVLFQMGRPKFKKVTGEEVQLMRATVLIAYGKNNVDILEKSGIRGRFIKLK